MSLQKSKELAKSQQTVSGQTLVQILEDIERELESIRKESKNA